MRFLLTNDDGIDAPGLATLARSVESHGESVTVAPTKVRSGCGHTVTDKQTISASTRGPDRHAVDGTPADCTRLGLLHLAGTVDWVLSGVNDGGNLGVDTHLSGTVAAAREAAILGKKAIALSQYRFNRREADWSTTTRLLKRVLPMLLERDLPPGRFWNVNFPDISDTRQTDDEIEIVFCSIDPSPLPVEYAEQDGRYTYQGVYANRPRVSGSDVDHCFSGRIAITLLRALSCETDTIRP